MDLPADNNILLSMVNTKLRDEYRSLEDLAEGENVDADEILSRLAGSGYYYDAAANRFI